jgi:uncharacterized protein YjiS (DUF1127 family)
MSPLTPKMRAAYHAFSEFRARRRTVQTLSAMDDVILNDIGISRSEIHSAVRSLSHECEGTAG